MEDEAIRISILSVVSVLLSACATTAQQSASTQAPCSSEAYRQFDFWLGTWDVTGPAGAHAGRNVITSAEGGCLIVEQWTSVNGTTGQSYNFYNPEMDRWRQVWVSQGSLIDYTGGRTETGSMKLEGEIHYHTGGSFPFRGEWTLQDDGTVRQHFEQFDPENGVWNPWFTGTYTKVTTAGG